MNVLELQHDTTRPYKQLNYKGIEYTVCRPYNHISRYKRLRQVIHYIESDSRFLLDRFVTLEIQNDYSYENLKIEYYLVPYAREHRLDLISYDFYNSTSYRWILAYINEISDGYSVFEGQVLMIPRNLSDLFAEGRTLASVAPTSLNLGTE